jgi:multiple sugar transport system permease protein
MQPLLRTKRSRESVAAFLLLLPATVFMVTFVLVPAVWAFILSFMQWNMISAPHFAGFLQWRKVFLSIAPRSSVTTTITIVLLSSPVAIIMGLLLAVVLDNIPFGKIFYRTVFFVPVIVTLTAISFVWLDLFNTQKGFFNYLLNLAGLPSVNWLTDPTMARLSVSIVLIWRNVGFNMLIFLAGLQGIDESYYDAAIVDGASETQQFLKITIPLLSPVTFFLFVLMIINGFQLYEPVYIITGGGPGYSTSTLVYFIYRTAFVDFNAGLASAMSMVLLVLIGLFTAISWTLQKRWVHYEN